VSAHEVQSAVKIQPSGPRGRRGYHSPFLPGLAALLVLLLLGGGVYLHFNPREPEPPVPDLGGLDPAIVAAVQTARAAVRKSPRSARAWGGLGMVLVVHEFLPEAQFCLAQAERLAPHEPRWPYCQALGLLFAKEQEAALPKLERAVALYGDEFDTPRVRLAEELLSLDRLDEAEQHFRHLLGINPLHPRAQLGMARLACKRRDFSASLVPLRFALNDPRTQKAANGLLAEVQERLGNQPEAEEALRRAATLPEDPFLPDPVNDEITSLRTGKAAWILRARQLSRLGHEREARTLLEQTVNDYPDADDAWLQLGKMLLKQKDLPAAEQALRRAADLAPGAHDNVYSLGVALLDRRDLSAATACFRRATELKPDFAPGWYNLGYCLYYEGDANGAIDAFHTALRYAPNLFEAEFNLARVLIEKGLSAEALVHARHARQLKPTDPEAAQQLDRVLHLLAVPLALP
jgi:tetratricopeptide (TPR) repeat protein